MRHFKFRAWNTDYQTPIMEYFDLKNEYKKLNCLYGKNIMQCTGLHDKNGKEIYEGDILKHNYYEEPQQVTFSDRFVAYKLQPADVFIQKVDEDLALIEVIGNIYKNPEVLF